MEHDPDEHRPATDPRLEIPEVLRTPVRQPGEIPGEARMPKESSISGVGIGFAMALDFVGSVGAGAFIGWLIDRWAGTSPVWVLVGLGFGFLGAMFRIIRQTQRQEALEKRRRGGK